MFHISCGYQWKEKSPFWSDIMKRGSITVVVIVLVVSTEYDAGMHMIHV